MVHVAVNKYDCEKINISEYAFGEGGGGHQKAYSVYAFINVDNCERPLILDRVAAFHNYATTQSLHLYNPFKLDAESSRNWLVF